MNTQNGPTGRDKWGELVMCKSERLPADQMWCGLLGVVARWAILPDWKPSGGVHALAWSEFQV